MDYHSLPHVANASKAKKFTWNEVWGLSMPKIMKVVADDTAFCKTIFNDIFNKKANVWKSSPCIKIVHERHWHACRFGTILFWNNTAYCCPVIKYVTGHLALNSLKKYWLRINDAQIHTTSVLLMNEMEPVRLNVDFLVPKFGNCEYSLNHPNESALYMTTGYSKAILNQYQSE